MTESEKLKASSEADIFPQSAAGPLVFISHDGRDAELAEAMPWLYELAMEVYRAVKSGNAEAIEGETKRLRHFSEVMMHGPFMEELGFGSRESHMFAMELPRMLEHMLRRTLQTKKTQRRRKVKKPQQKQEAND